MTDIRLHRILRAAAASAALLGAAPAFAVSLDITGGTQADFHSVAQDITAALDDKALAPATPGGLLGFSIDSYGTYASTRDSGAWQRLTGSSVDGLGAVGVRASKGLPFGFDVGGFYARVPGTNASTYGGDFRYAVLDGGLALPAIAVRATYTRAGNAGDFDYRSYGGDVSVSKGFLLLTPYAGAGYVRSVTRADGSTGLDKEGLNRGKFFAGLAFKLLILDATAEYERLGSNNAYSLKLGLGF